MNVNVHELYFKDNQSISMWNLSWKSKITKNPNKKKVFPHLTKVADKCYHQILLLTKKPELFRRLTRILDITDFV